MFKVPMSLSYCWDRKRNCLDGIASKFYRIFILIFDKTPHASDWVRRLLVQVEPRFTGNGYPRSVFFHCHNNVPNVDIVTLFKLWERSIFNTVAKQRDMFVSSCVWPLYCSHLIIFSFLNVKTLLMHLWNQLFKGSLASV